MPFPAALIGVDMQRKTSTEATLRKIPFMGLAWRRVIEGLSTPGPAPPAAVSTRAGARTARGTPTLQSRDPEFTYTVAAHIFKPPGTRRRRAVAIAGNPADTVRSGNEMLSQQAYHFRYFGD